MTHPAYHLRFKKAIERGVFVEGIRLLGQIEKLSEYTYIGFGGPYLEEFRVLYEVCPELKMISLEENQETFKRQSFHLPGGVVDLQLHRFASFLAQYEARDEKSIFWLDYTGLEYSCFDELMGLLPKVAVNSMIKISLRAEPMDYAPTDRSRGTVHPADTGREDNFRRQFESLMPEPSAPLPSTRAPFAALIQNLTQVACQRALPGILPLTFQPISSFYYADGVGMFTLTGIVCEKTKIDFIRDTFKALPFANLDWEPPRLIDVPMLSTKERLHLQGILPHGKGAGKALHKALGYLVDEDRKHTEKSLQQYADFHRHLPYFMKAVP